MQIEAKALVFDMLQACERISEFTVEKDCASYVSDVYCKSAVERQFQIMGEALNRLVQNFPEFAAEIPAHREIINFRNILVHGYNRVEDEMVWGVIKAHLPVLTKNSGKC